MNKGGELMENIMDKINKFLESCFTFFDSFFHNLGDIPHYVNLSYARIHEIFDGMPEFVLWSALVVCGIGIITKITHYGG